MTDVDRGAALAIMRSGDSEYELAGQGAALLGAWQQDRCALCGHRLIGDYVLDHDHVTGFARGWLDRGCNISEGTSSHGDMRRYRERPPAVMFGLEVFYYSPWADLARPEWCDNGEPMPDTVARAVRRWNAHRDRIFT